MKYAHLTCDRCKRVRRVDIGYCERQGWPCCCHHYMRLEFREMAPCTSLELLLEGQGKDGEGQG
jgi:hypothetical protein